MRYFLFIFLFISCKIVKPPTPVNNAARLVTLTTAQLTAVVNQQKNTIDSLIQVIVGIKNNIVYVNTSQWDKDSLGGITLKNKVYIDTIVTKGTLYVTTLASDTATHSGADTLVHENEIFDHKIADTVPTPAAIFKRRK